MFTPNTLRLRPSLRLCALLCLPYLAALSLITSSSAPVWPSALAVLAITASGIRQVLRHGLLRLASSPRQLQLPPDPGATVWRLWRGTCRDAAMVTPCGDSVVTASFILLRLQSPSPARRDLILLTPWNTDQEALRRLRVVLRFARRAPPDKAVATE